MKKTAFITGITGQDGSYLAELLLDKGYEVHGLIRKVSHGNSTERIEHILDKLQLHTANLTNIEPIMALFNQIKPHEVYNLAAQSHAGMSYSIPHETVEINSLGTLNILEAIRVSSPTSKLYQASTSEMFGDSPPPQNETTLFHPNSPYACSKVYSYYQLVNYRESYNIFACNGICFNHESPRRTETFVTRKITKAAARIKLGLQSTLKLGNIETSRDWGFAGDYVEAMWLMLQKDNPDDYVIATGITHSIRELLELAFSKVNLNWEDYVQIDQNLIRPKDHITLLGDASKAKKLLGWEPKVSFEELIDKMVKSDLDIESRYIGR